ncbi:MAG: hypothetical protein ACUVR2_09480, partial [Anaerolineae bacterium]
PWTVVQPEQRDAEAFTTNYTWQGEARLNEGEPLSLAMRLSEALPPSMDGGKRNTKRKEREK